MNTDQWFLDASQPQRIMDLNQYLGIMNANTLFIRILADQSMVYLYAHSYAIAIHSHASYVIRDNQSYICSLIRYRYSFTGVLILTEKESLNIDLFWINSYWAKLFDRDCLWEPLIHTYVDIHVGLLSFIRYRYSFADLRRWRSLRSNTHSYAIAIHSLISESQSLNSTHE